MRFCFTRKDVSLGLLVCVFISEIAAGQAMAEENTALDVPTITKAELPGLAARCAEESKNNHSNLIYSLISGTQIFSTMHSLPAGVPPIKISDGLYANEYNTYELHIKKDESIYKVFIGSRKAIVNPKSIFVNDMNYGICAALNPANGRYSGILSTLVIIKE